MPLLNHLHDWMQVNGGLQCHNCTAFMTDALAATYTPNDNDAAMADVGDDQSIWQQAWMQTTQTTT